ncbi:hypothetical protein AQUCO_11900004v1 [Aquilegia coerulea]|uniref:Ubiquitin-like protease family profile domain-containing protein n=1 Tax=Aquilegia coerulea TaxID=218851 RepID=A0A2G5C394_AQUCA|nr:hypothetical protein AQUCO_11900004v1 [Aquilegia coerulea]
MKQRIPMTHMDAMMKTPFGRLFNLFLDNGVRDETITGQNKDLLCDIISRYSHEEDAFRIGQGENAKYVKFKPEHVSLAFGLPLDGKRVSDVFRRFKYDPESSSFLKFLDLAKNSVIKKEEMVAKLNLLLTLNDQYDHFCRMVAVFLAATLFFANSNTNIGLSFVSNIESLQTMNSISWTHVIYDKLMEKIKEHTNKPLSVNAACVIPLLIKEDFQDLTEAEKQLLEKVVIQEEVQPKDYDQLLKDHEELITQMQQMKENYEGQILELQRKINELEKESIPNKREDEVSVNNFDDGISDGDNTVENIDEAEAEIENLKHVHEKDEAGAEIEIQMQVENKDAAEVGNQRGQVKTFKSKLALKRKETQQKNVEVENEKKQYCLRAKAPRKVEDAKVMKSKTLKLGRKKKAENNDEIIEVEKIVTVSKSVEAGASCQLRNITDSRHYNYFEEKEKATVLQFFSLCHTFSNAYMDDTLTIQGRLLEDLMFDKFTSSEVIDFYSKWLKKHSSEGAKSLYVSSVAWTHLKADQKKCVQRTLHDVLEKELADDIKYVFIPMNTSKSRHQAKGYHWTLLVLNYQDKKFEHYDSMKPRKGLLNLSYEEAVVMRNEVVDWINSHRAETKKSKISWLKGVKTPTCPQQGTTSDCGIYVCKIMESLSREEKLHTGKDFQSDVEELRPTLTYLMLADNEHSWNINKLAKDLD